MKITAKTTTNYKELWKLLDYVELEANQRAIKIIDNIRTYKLPNEMNATSYLQEQLHKNHIAREFLFRIIYYVNKNVEYVVDDFYFEYVIELIDPCFKKFFDDYYNADKS